MRAESCRIVLRPRGVLETFDLVGVFVQANARTLGRLLLFTVVPASVLCGVVAWLAGGHPAAILLPLPLLGVIQLPFTALAGRLLFSRTAHPWEQGIRGVPLQVLPLLAVARLGLAVASAMTLGLALFLAPGLHFLPEILVLERVGPSRAFGRAMRIGAHEPLAAFAGAGARVFLTIWSALVFEALGQLVLGTGLQLGEPFGALWNGEVTPFLLAGMLVAQPLHALYRLLLYIDARTRVEGWDLQVALWSVRPREAA